MELTVLQTVRLLAPGVMIYLVLVAICWTTRWCDFTIPKNLEDVAKLFVVVILGVIYNISDLTDMSNKKYFDQVNQNLTTRLTEPFKSDPDVPKGLTWSKVRIVFYSIVDSDESLKVKAKLAYRNGAFWTSVADLRVISAVGCVLFLCTLLVPYVIPNTDFAVWRALFMAGVLLAIFALSFPASERLTARHLEIGNEQVDQILTNHRKDLKEGLIRAGS